MLNLKETLGEQFEALALEPDKVEEQQSPFDNGIKAPKGVVGEHELSTMFNYEEYQRYKQASPTYRSKKLRIDPWSVETIFYWVENHNPSAVLGREIYTFTDAYKHAQALCQAWAAEDEVERSDAEAKAKKEKKLSDLEKAKQAWRDAVAKRKATWDSMTEECDRLRGIFHQKRDAL